MTATIAAEVLSGPQWRARRAAHEARVDGWIAEHRDRRRVGRKHPVEDFLFTYYSSRPRQLRRWHPGAGVLLADADPADFGPDYTSRSAGVTLDAARVRSRRGEAIAWMREAARWYGVAAAPVRLLRHARVGDGLPAIRRTSSATPTGRCGLTPAETAAVVDANRVRCSHFDAFRFFTPPARPLNVLQPTRASQAALEQPGCLHANMDLYKWAYKLSPLISSELVADCFALAREIRTVDMQASPYDLTGLGYAPIRVETVEGRAEYVAAQRDFADRAGILRIRLIDAIDAAMRTGDQ